MTAAAHTAEATLRELRGWIDHWERDRQCGLAPTEGSLRDAAEAIDAALTASALLALGDRPDRPRRGRIVGLAVRYVPKLGDAGLGLNPALV